MMARALTAADFILMVEAVSNEIDWRQSSADQQPNAKSWQTDVTQADYPALTGALTRLNVGDTGVRDELNIKLGLKNNIIEKFYLRGFSVPYWDADDLARRMLEYLGGLALRAGASSARQDVEPQPTSFSASTWARIPDRQSVKQTIHSLSVVLDDLIARTEGANLPEGERAFTAIERAEILAILRTALQMLGAPMIEKGLLKRSKETVEGIAKRTAVKKTEEGLGSLADSAGEFIVSLIRDLFG